MDTGFGSGVGGEIVEMTQAGAVVATIALPDEATGNFYYYPFGFSIASDGSLWVAQPGDGNVIHLDPTGNLIQSYSLGSGALPEWTAVRSDGQVFVSNENGAVIQQLDPGTGNLSTFAVDPAGLPFGLSFTASGDLLVTDPNFGVLRYDGSRALTQAIQDFNGAIDAEADPSGDVVVAGIYNTVDRFTSGGALIIGTSVPGNPIGVAVLGSEGAPPAPSQAADYYKIEVQKGQNVTVVLSDLGGTSGDITLLSPSGVPLALGKVINGSEETINSYIATAKGTYYVRVTGNGVQYSLVTLLNSDFNDGSNTTQAGAQNLFHGSNGYESVLGHLSSTSLWGVDWQGAPNQLIHTIDTLTGNFTSTFSGPTTPLTAPYGFNMAFDGTYLWFNDGADFGSNTIFKLDPASGAVLGSFTSPTPLLTGLAYLNGSLWGTDGAGVYQIDPATGQLLNQFSPGLNGAVTGLAGDPSRGVLWAVSQFHTLYEIDPVAQTITMSAYDGLGLFEQDLGYYNNELYVSESNGPGANDIAVIDAGTLAVTRDLPMNVPTYISGLAADGFALAASNYYRVSTGAHDKLFIRASSPLNPSQGPFQPPNTLIAVLQLYDAQGNLLATSKPGGSISYKVQAAGDYFVRISGAGTSTGDYRLSVSGATGGLPAFDVTGTNPPAGSYNKPIASITVDFNDSILLPSLATANVTFGGVPATGYMVDNDHEVTWYLQATPPGLNVAYTFQITAGSIKDIHGAGLAGFSETLIINTVPPDVIATSIEEGDVDPAGNLTYVVSFQEPINPSSVSTSSFDLHGIYRSADYGAVSYAFNANDTTLTINYTGLPQDDYTLTLFSSGFMDQAGYFLDGEPHTPRPPSVPSGNGVEGGDFFVDFTLRHGTVALPVAFAPVNPIGSLIYQGSFADVVASPPNAPNAYTVSLAPHQTLTLDLTSDGNLQGWVAIYDPSNNLIGSAFASGKGGEALLQTAPVVSGGTYTIVVGGLNGTLGLFNLQATLNAALENGLHGGPSNGSLATAQNIGGSFVSLGGSSSRGAVLGGIDQLVVNPGDVYVSERGGPGVLVVANGGGVLSGINNPIFGTGVVGGIHEGPDGNLYVALSSASGEILKFAPGGTLLGVIPLPGDTPSIGYYYPFGFSSRPTAPSGCRSRTPATSSTWPRPAT